MRKNNTIPQINDIKDIEFLITLMILPDEYLDCGLTSEENIFFNEEEKKLFNILDIINLGNGIVFAHKLQSIPPILTLTDMILLLFLIAT